MRAKSKVGTGRSDSYRKPTWVEPSYRSTLADLVRGLNMRTKTEGFVRICQSTPNTTCYLNTNY